MRLNFLGLLILVIIVGGAVGGAYGAGIVVGKGGAPASATVQAPVATGDTSAQGANARGAIGGGAILGGTGGASLAGTVEKLEGSTLTISAQSGGSTQVTVNDNTTIRKTADSGREELKQGVRVVVVGQPGSGGNVVASSIQIVPADSATPAQQQRSRPQGTPISAP